MASNYDPDANAGSKKRPRDMLCELNSVHINQGMLEVNHILLQHVCVGKYIYFMISLIVNFCKRQNLVE